MNKLLNAQTFTERKGSRVFKSAEVALATCKVSVICYKPVFEQGPVIPGNLGRAVRLILSAADRVTETTALTNVTGTTGEKEPGIASPNPKQGGDKGSTWI